MAKRKILVVDDEPDFLKMIKKRLEDNSYEVVTAKDGKEALVKIAAEKPSAVLLDIMMPEIDGISVLKTIRAKDKDLPIFMCTASTNVEKFRVSRQLNASGYIFKTADLKKEVENITKFLHLADKFKGTK
ncbi:MAG: response regulator [Candidatus Omnitrophota bacterium]